MSAAWVHQSLKLIRANKSDLSRASRGVGGNFRAGVERDDPATAGHAGGGVRAREQHPYGLSAGIWTDKSFRHLTPALSPFGAEREKFVRLRAGVVWANTYNKFDPTSLPRGRDGYQESGSRLRNASAQQVGREGGLQGLAAYCRLAWFVCRRRHEESLIFVFSLRLVTSSPYRKIVRGRGERFY